MREEWLRRLTRAIQARGPKRDTNSKTAEMVELISEIGPDIPEIARRLGQYKESVRYRYKKKVLGKGFAIQAIPAYEELGMRRVLLVASFARDFQPFAQAILSAMSELCYVVSFAPTMLKGKYIVDASVPEKFLGEFADLVRSLVVKGLFTEAEVFDFDLFMNVPMKAGNYDFDRGIWDFDWKMDGSTYIPPAKPVRKSFDYTDLLILKELHKDATQSMTDIAANLRINYKKLAWHYVTHVLGRRLIRTYLLNWMGTRYDFKLEKALHRRHRYLLVVVLVKQLREGEALNIVHGLRLPFIWSWAAGRSYYAQVALPVDVVNEGFQFIRDVLAPFSDRVEYFVVDQANALAFTVSYKLYDERLRSWTFDSQEVSRRFDDLLVKIKEGAG